jgi:HAD superfamily hydrolase (TIGR01509 family)
MNQTIRAIIFDFNGVICNDEPIHFQATTRVLSELGISLSDEEYNQNFLGCADRESFGKIITERSSKPVGKLEVEQLIARKSDYYLDVVSAGPPFVPGAIEFIREAARSYHLAIASGALRREIDFVLSAGGLIDFFPVVISADDNSYSKPHPHVYQRVLEKMGRGLLPADCVAIEDSARGVASAKNAGMKCLALTTTLSHEVLSNADWILPGFPPLESVPWSPISEGLRKAEPTIP